MFLLKKKVDLHLPVRLYVRLIQSRLDWVAVIWLLLLLPLTTSKRARSVQKNELTCVMTTYSRKLMGVFLGRRLPRR